jgi:SAM-dependent methyltransferase
MGNPIRYPLTVGMGGQERIHRFRYHFARGYVEPEDTVLDIGCGLGYGSKILSKVAKKVIGFDLDERYVESAKGLCRENDEFFQADALSLKEYPKCDVSVAMEILEHTFEPYEVARKMMEATKKYIVFSVPVGERHIYNEEFGFWHAEADGSHLYEIPSSSEAMSWWNLDEWIGLHGFMIDSCFVTVLLSKRWATEGEEHE